jgi:hypothetical protein
MSVGNISQGCYRALFYGVVPFLFIACAAQNEMLTTPAQRAAVVGTLTSGDIRLTCHSLSCVGAWGAARQNVKGLYSQGLWSDLANEVVRIGYSSDLPYFYLAKAAEGLGASRAAVVYYNLAMASSDRCDRFINNCDGFKVRDEAAKSLERLGKPPTEAAPSVSTYVPATPLATSPPLLGSAADWRPTSATRLRMMASACATNFAAP